MLSRFSFKIASAPSQTKVDMRRFFREFGPTLLLPETYNVRHNMFALFGLLWGLPIPVMAMGLNFYLIGQTPTPGAILQLLREHPIHVFFLAHPFFFMVVFGAIGVLRRRADERIDDLVDKLQKHLLELDHANRQLLQLDRLKDEFLANVTHELRTPLVTIRGYTEMFLHGRMGSLSEKQERSLNIVNRNVRRLLALISDILTLSRLDRREVLKKQKPFSLGEALEHITAAIRPSVEQNNIEILLDVHDPGLEIIGLQDRIEQVFINLLTNAIKFTEAGGSITISTRPGTPGRLVASVEDTGCGIPEENLPLIFDRFVQVDGSIRRRHGGAGLGLSITREILEAHDCTIWASSAPGKGARFTFDLPIHGPDAV